MGFEREAYSSDKQVYRSDAVEVQPHYASEGQSHYAYPPPTAIVSPDYTDASRYSNIEPATHTEQAPGERAHICGVPRRTFFLMLGAVLLIMIAIILGLGIGLGVGLSGMNRNSNNAASLVGAATTTTTILSPSSSSLASTVPATSTGTTTSTTATTSIATVAAASAVSSGHSCPSANGTTITNGGYNFLVLCNNDITSPLKTNLAVYTQPSFDACITQCSALETLNGAKKDISAVWYRLKDPQNMCWCITDTLASENASTLVSAGADSAWIQG